jgi:DNA replication protein DnaD
MDTVVKMERRSKTGSKREKFRGLAEARTNKAIEAIGRIGNLSNRQIYEYEEAEVRKVIRALKEAVASVEARFESPRGKAGGGFKL